MTINIKEVRRHLLRYCVPIYGVALAQMIANRLWPQAGESVSLSLFFAVVMASAWYGGLGPGLLASVLALTASNFFDAGYGYPNSAGAQVVQVSAFLFTTLLISLLNGVRKRLNGELAESLAQVKLLSGLLPICASCKMIREGENCWCPVETYISEHSEATFTHGVCPDCYQKLYPESYEKYKKHLQANA